MSEYHRLEFLKGAQDISEKHLQSVMLHDNITIPKGRDPQEFLVERKKSFSEMDHNKLKTAILTREEAWQLALMDWLYGEKLIAGYQFRIDCNRLTIMVQPLAQCRMLQVGLTGETVQAPPPQN